MVQPFSAATPHANPTFQYDPHRNEELILELQSAAPAGLLLVRGSDFHLTHNNIMDAVRFPFKYTLNGNRYLLVELSDLVIFPNTGDQYQRLEEAGLKLIVTHPERNLILQQRPELIDEWVEQGRLMQVTAGSLLGRFGRRAQELGRQLVARGLAHFVASDGHDAEHRQPRLDQAYQWLTNHHGRPMADLLCLDNPRAAIEGGEIQPAPSPGNQPEPASSRSLWRRLFRS